MKSKMGFKIAKWRNGEFNGIQEYEMLSIMGFKIAKWRYGE